MTSTMPRYTLEYRAPKHTKWHRLSVSALVPFTDDELGRYRQQIAERTTADRGVAVFADQIQLRVLKDGKPEPLPADKHHAQDCATGVIL